MFNKIVVTKIHGIFTVTHSKGSAAKITERSSFGLSFCLGGQLTYTHNGSKVTSDSGHAVILPQGETYTLSCEKAGSFPVINFSAEDKICGTIMSVPIQNTDAYVKDFEKMRALSLFDGNEAEIMSIFYHILHKLSSQHLPDSVILPAIKYLEQNYHCPQITNAELARQCSISEIYFRRLFKKYYNTSPRQFLIDIRINKAKQLLREGALKTCAVAELCGFSSRYHFCRCFREKTGMTPTEYMNTHKIYKI